MSKSKHGLSCSRYHSKVTQRKCKTIGQVKKIDLMSVSLREINIEIASFDCTAAEYINRRAFCCWLLNDVKRQDGEMCGGFLK